MNIDIIQYRASIGTFNSKYKVIKVQMKPMSNVSYKHKVTFKMGNTYNLFLYIFIMSFLLLYSSGGISINIDDIMNQKIKIYNNMKHRSELNSLLFYRHANISNF